METDPVKLGTMKLMGTFGVPSYISFGDEYMKKIRKWGSLIAILGGLAASRHVVWGGVGRRGLDQHLQEFCSTVGVQALTGHFVCAAADPRYKGKQLQTNPGHKGIAGARGQNTMFEEKFKMLYEGEKYSQQNYYNVDMSVRTS